MASKPAGQATSAPQGAPELFAARRHVAAASQNAKSWTCPGISSEHAITARRVKAWPGSMRPTTRPLIAISKDLPIAEDALKVSRSPSATISKRLNMAEGLRASASTLPDRSKVQ